MEVTAFMYLTIRLFSSPCSKTEEEKRKVNGEIELYVLRKYREKLHGISGRELEGKRLLQKQVSTKWKEGRQEKQGGIKCGLVS